MCVMCCCVLFALWIAACSVAECFVHHRVGAQDRALWNQMDRRNAPARQLRRIHVAFRAFFAFFAFSCQGNGRACITAWFVAWLVACAALFRELREKITSTLITTGEHEYTRYGFRKLLEGKCIDLLQPGELLLFPVFSPGLSLCAKGRMLGAYSLRHCFDFRHHVVRRHYRGTEDLQHGLGL